MAKRARAGKDELTGGTKDVNPQIYTIFTTQPSADAFVSTAFPLPVTRFSQLSGKTIVVEILKIFWTLTTMIPTSSGITQQQLIAYMSTVQFTSNPGNVSPLVFSSYQKEGSSAFSATGTYEYVIKEPFVSDLTDGAGHGFLVATDNIYISCGSSFTSQTNSVTAKILYRFKEVGLAEYIGIVQSQQA